MTYITTYLSEVGRVIQAVMIDDRANQFPSNADGNTIKPIVDATVAAIGNDSIPYKIESDNGSLVGFFVLLADRVTFTATVQKKIIRPQFAFDTVAIDSVIGGFVNGDEWKQDVL